MDEVVPMADGGQALLSPVTHRDLADIARLYGYYRWTPEWLGQRLAGDGHALDCHTFVADYGKYEGIELPRLLQATRLDAGSLAVETAVGYIVRDARTHEAMSAAIRTLPPRNPEADPAYRTKALEFVRHGVSGCGTMHYGDPRRRPAFERAFLTGKVGGTVLIVRHPDARDAAEWVVQRAVTECHRLRPDMGRLWTYFLHGVEVFDPFAPGRVRRLEWAVNRRSWDFLARLGYAWLAHEAVDGAKTDVSGPAAVPFVLPGRTVYAVPQWGHLDGDASEIVWRCERARPRPPRWVNR